MATFDELKKRYMISNFPGEGGGGPSGGGSGPAIPSFSNCRVSPLVHGKSYFPALKAAINAVSGSESFIYIAGWFCSETFSLDGATGGSLLSNLLKAKAKAGVDVRVLGWIFAPEVLKSKEMRDFIRSGNPAADGLKIYLGINDHTMQFVEDLRIEPALTNKAVLNILAHPAGAVHMKFALIGTGSQATGFTGGIDTENSRWGTRWHDVAAEVNGPVLQDFFKAFQQMWNEVRGRSPKRVTALTKTLDTHSTSTPNLPNRSVSSAGSGTVHAQSLRTLPRYEFPVGVSMSPLPTNSELSFAPNGLFEVKAAWEKAIKAAQRYIYIEDQNLWSHEVMTWINEAVRRNSELRVILLTSSAGDPTEPLDPTRLKYYTDAINKSLLAGLSASSPEIKRIGFFLHHDWFIHTKSTIIDDQWAVIGSANHMRRSLYTDLEHSVAFMDENGAAVPSYREKLWGEHFRASVVDLTAAINAWFAIPFHGTPPAVGAIPIDRQKLPMPAVTLTPNDLVKINTILDHDSRNDWGKELRNLGGGVTVSPGS